jgi:hypothetical protein
MATKCNRPPVTCVCGVHTHMRVKTAVQYTLDMSCQGQTRKALA